MDIITALSMVYYPRNWTERHFEIVKKSDEKFKTHTSDQEIDI